MPVEATSCRGWPLIEGVRQAAIDVTPEVQRRFNDELQAERADSSFAGSCNSWYKTATGKITSNWSGSVEDYRAATARLDPGAYDIADAEGGPAEDREPGPASH